MSDQPTNAQIEAEYAPRLRALAVSMATLGLRERLAAGDVISADQALAYLETRAAADPTSAASMWFFFMQQRRPEERAAFAADWDAELAARAARTGQEAQP